MIFVINNIKVLIIYVLVFFREYYLVGIDVW